MRSKIEQRIQYSLFASRWLLAPIYIGLIGALSLVLLAFLRELWACGVEVQELSTTDVILASLSLIDLSLVANLLIIVIFSGYENFVSKMDLDNHKDNPDWKDGVDFFTLKIKLVSSMVAISGIHLLKVFMRVEEIAKDDLKWLVIIHVTFLVSGVFLAISDYISSTTKK